MLNDLVSERDVLLESVQRGLGDDYVNPLQDPAGAAENLELVALHVELEQTDPAGISSSSRGTTETTTVRLKYVSPGLLAGRNDDPPTSIGTSRGNSLAVRPAAART